MPDVNLLKDTQQLSTGAKKPVPPPQPELSDPTKNSGEGIMAKLKSLFNRVPKPLPVARPVVLPKLPRPDGTMATKKIGGDNDRILSEKRHNGPAVVPLPEDDDAGFNVNLLTEELVMPSNPRRRLIQLGVIAGGAIVVVGLAFGGLLLYQQNIKKQITSTESQLTDVQQRIAQLSVAQKQAAATTQKLSAISSLVSRHTRWTKFFAMIEKYTMPKVTYGAGFSGNLNGALSFSATTDSYETVAQQYLIFEQLVANHQFISAFSITGATSSTDKDGKIQVHFTVSMTLLPNDFTLSADEVAAVSGQSSADTPSPTQ